MFVPEKKHKKSKLEIPFFNPIKKHQHLLEFENSNAPTPERFRTLNCISHLISDSNVFSSVFNCVAPKMSIEKFQNGVSTYIF